MHLKPIFAKKFKNFFLSICNLFTNSRSTSYAVIWTYTIILSFPEKKVQQNLFYSSEIFSQRNNQCLNNTQQKFVSWKKYQSEKIICKTKQNTNSKYKTWLISITFITVLYFEQCLRQSWIRRKQKKNMQMEKKTMWIYQVQIVNKWMKMTNWNWIHGAMMMIIACGTTVCLENK